MDQGVLGMIGMATSLVSLVCWILTLVKMFQNDTVLKGILGILCPLWALIWGWMEADRVNHKNVMIVWSIAIAAGIVLNVMTVMNNPGLQGGGAPALPPAMLIPGL